MVLLKDLVERTCVSFQLQQGFSMGIAAVVCRLKSLAVLNRFDRRQLGLKEPCLSLAFPTHPHHSRKLFSPLLPGAVVIQCG